MRFPSRLDFRADRFARGLLLVAFGAVILGLGGACADKHIGRVCQLNVATPDAGSSGGGVATITSPALECPSRICILPDDENGQATSNGEGAFCTYPCSTNDDCSDSDPDSQCKSGFLCAWPTTIGPFCCQKLCVCHDFLHVPTGGLQPPEACMSSAANSAACPNVH
jgi:hypothetical protein